MWKRVQYFGHSIKQEQNQAMKEFNDLVGIISILSELEYNLIIDPKRKKDQESSFQLKLISFVKDNKETNLLEVQRFLYGKPKKLAFHKLVQRTKEGVLDVIISNSFIIKYTNYDERSRHILLLRKRLLQVDILVLRGLIKMSIGYLNKIIKKAKDYEYYDVLVFALYKKMRLTLSSATAIDYVKQHDELLYFEDCRRVFHKFEMFTSRLFQELSVIRGKSNKLIYLQNLLSELESDVKRVKSISININLKWLKCELFEMKEEFYQAHKETEGILLYYAQYKLFASDYGLGATYLNLAKFDLLLMNFDDAARNLNKAFNFLKTLDYNRCLVYQYQFLHGFYTADPKTIELKLNLLNTYLYSGIAIGYMSSSVNYYNSCVKFILGEYFSSYLSLDAAKEFEQDKEAWNISVRVLSIMNQIELENFEIADNLIDNLRKYYERIKKNLVVSKRDEKIIQILTALKGHSYHFRTTYRKKADAFDLLESLDSSYRWKILSPEMIIFHEWFKAKVANLKYDHFNLMPQMMKKYSGHKKASLSLSEDVKTN